MNTFMGHTCSCFLTNFDLTTVFFDVLNYLLSMHPEIDDRIVVVIVTTKKGNIDHSIYPILQFR